MKRTPPLAELSPSVGPLGKQTGRRWMTPAAAPQIDQRTVSLSEASMDPSVCCLASSPSAERSPENRPDWRQRRHPLTGKSLDVCQ